MFVALGLPATQAIAQIDRAAIAADAYAKEHPREHRMFGHRGGTPADTTPWREYASVKQFESAMDLTALFEFATVTFGTSKVLRSAYFDEVGRLLRRTERALDLETQKRVIPTERELMDVETPVYLKASKLPFSNLLAR